ncbi:TRAP transporter large permease [Afifella marina]|uniref:TRAP transporter large permease protein n=2 Tax=Hyphomicrobiales TaxID=356 RepID=A0A1G5P1C6_AFIMA|nr:TRAP transporter large permease [Afifella marina]MBK1624286.1 TRAP transporter large permease [Afifella marina DSM 2698]MBK1628019.1 TRAP transporter large permease [Afifella marina]MBK5918213.1 C4-dicarboxylate ABC transporter permease [Afifella marina]RAI19254.1 C4-dicarboxylate ABC transporter permease [Afifella marina DSM 2698]SCZ43334.1 C4-dicarboxylate transporter, DctM subunit [Afifella marina DSM 2698]
MFDLDAGTQMVIIFFVLLFLRVPVAFALGLSAVYAMWAIGFGLDMAGDLIASGIAKFSLLAIPFFILAGTLMGSLGIAERMIAFFRILVGGLPGGMGLVGTVVCLFWGAVSGSGPASVAAIGPLIVRGMAEDGYPRAFAAGLVCAGAGLSIVIPPSIGLVIYGVIAETSISDLFTAAIIPGLVMGLLMLVALPFVPKVDVNEMPPSLERLMPQAFSELPYGRRLWRSFLHSFWGLMTPLVILGGIYSGIFTPTEAAIVATVYALFVGGLVYRTLSFATLYEALSAAAASSAVVMLVVAYASLFGWVVTVDDLIGKYSTVLLGLSDQQWVILIVIMLILLIAGMFMDAITIMFITLPIFLPVMRELGWDPVWFGVLVMVNLAIGLFTPPVGINLYVAANMTSLPLEKIARGAVPFLITSLIGLILIAAFPGLSNVLVEALK